MRPPRALAVPLCGVLAASTLLALPALTSGAAADGLPARQQLAQAQGPKSGGNESKSSEGTPPLRWLQYSSERFQTLMRMLATRAARSEAKRAEDAKRAADAKAAEEARLAEAKRIADAKAADHAKRAADAKAAEEARLAEAKRIADAKAADHAKRAADTKAAEEARLAEAKRIADAKAAEAKVAEEAKRAAETKQTADAKRTVAPTQVAEAPKPPAGAKVAQTKKPASERPERAPATCRNAGVKVSGAGWYVAQVGDSLWSIARAHYGYGKAYRRIHAANRRSITNPARIYPCQRIYIPRLSGLGGAPAPGQRLALAPFVRARPIRTRMRGIAA